MTDNEKELSPIQKLAIAQAIYKAVADIVSTKSNDSLRAQIDRDVYTNYTNTGAKSYDVWLFDEKVGTISARINKPTKQTKLRVSDMHEYIDWCFANDCITTDDKAAEKKFLETGEIPDGCEIEEIEVGGGFAGTTLKIDKQKVFDLVHVHGLLDDVTNTLLLGDGETWE